MNTVRRLTAYEVDVAYAETTDAKIDALRSDVDEVKQDLRELRAEVKADVRELRDGLSSLRDKVDKNYAEMQTGFAAIRGEMQAGFTAIRSETHTGFAEMRESIAELRATVRTVFAVLTLVVTLAVLFFTAGTALHWFESPERNRTPAARMAVEASARVTSPSMPSPPAISPREMPGATPR